MDFPSIMFSVLAAFAVVSALLVVTRRNPVMSALFLIMNFFCLAGLYLTLHAQFIAVIQILVYAGAIMVLFVFVIMLLNLGDERKLSEGISWRKLVAVGMCSALLLEFIYILGFAESSSAPLNAAKALEIGTVEFIGSQLFTRFLFPFEITSLILTAAIVGAIVLAKRKIE